MSRRTHVVQRLRDRLIERPAARRQSRITAREWDGGFAVMVQTCDPFLYFDMLVASSRSNRVFCRRWGLAYAAFVGIKRGFHPWQAMFNRILLLQEYLEQGYGGWVLYLDADAYVWDLGFDIKRYLADKSSYAAVLTPSGIGVPAWSVNDGVAFFNLGHEAGRRLVAAWHASFMRVSDDALRAAGRWELVRNDQDMLQAILREDAWLREHVFLEATELINSREARCIRQVLRAQVAELPARVHIIESEVAEALRRAGETSAAS